MMKNQIKKDPPLWAMLIKALAALLGCYALVYLFLFIGMQG